MNTPSWNKKPDYLRYRGRVYSYQELLELGQVNSTAFQFAIPLNEEECEEYIANRTRRELQRPADPVLSKKKPFTIKSSSEFQDRKIIKVKTPELKKVEQKLVSSPTLGSLDEENIRMKELQQSKKKQKRDQPGTDKGFESQVRKNRVLNALVEEIGDNPTFNHLFELVEQDKKLSPWAEGSRKGSRVNTLVICPPPTGPNDPAEPTPQSVEPEQKLMNNFKLRQSSRPDLSKLKQLSTVPPANVGSNPIPFTSSKVTPQPVYNRPQQAMSADPEADSDSGGSVQKKSTVESVSPVPPIPSVPTESLAKEAMQDIAEQRQEGEVVSEIENEQQAIQPPPQQQARLIQQQPQSVNAPATFGNTHQLTVSRQALPLNFQVMAELLSWQSKCRYPQKEVFQQKMDTVKQLASKYLTRPVNPSFAQIKVKDFQQFKRELLKIQEWHKDITKQIPTIKSQQRLLEEQRNTLLRDAQEKLTAIKEGFFFNTETGQEMCLIQKQTSQLVNYLNSLRPLYNSIFLNRAERYQDPMHQEVEMARYLNLVYAQLEAQTDQILSNLDSEYADASCGQTVKALAEKALMLGAKISDLQRTQHIRLTLLKRKLQSMYKEKEFEKSISEFRASNDRRWETFDTITASQKWLDRKRETSIESWWNDMT